MLIAGKTIKNKNTGIEIKNIVRHKVVPTGISISLTEWERTNRNYTVSLSLKDFNSNCYTLGKFSNIDDAEKYYNKVLSAVNSGIYKLHIYDSGKVELEL
ncbi:MAG: hypothetical protein HY738_03920 [Bacteroidia bacterium]|nr:hypothetical protein [Bacteroidia bacterium]